MDESQYDFTEIDNGASFLDHTKSFIHTAGITKNTVPVFKTKTMGMHRSASIMINNVPKILEELEYEPKLPSVKIVNYPIEKHNTTLPSKTLKAQSLQPAK